MQISTDAEFNRYSISCFDLEKALEFAIEAGKHLSDALVYEALLFSAIVSYGRPFSGNERDKNAHATSSLSVDDFPSLSAEERELHDKCIELRNKALAHAEFSYNPTRFDPTTGIVSSRPFSLFATPFDLIAFIQIIDKMKNAFEQRRAGRVLGQRRG